MMEIKKICLGMFGTNTYILSKNNESIIIDPAGRMQKLDELIGDNKLIAVLLTHGHFDHIKPVDDLYAKYHIPVYINPLDEDLARDKNQTKAFNIPFSNVITCPVVKLSQGLLSIGPFNFEVYFTPGHTEGSTIFKIDNYLFTGDTLFKNSVGRTDLKGGNNTKLKESLRFMKTLDPNLIIHPGHEQSSTLYDEIENNPYLKLL